VAPARGVTSGPGASRANPPGGGGSLPNPNDCALPPPLTVLPSRGGARRPPCPAMPAPPTSVLDSGRDCISVAASVLRDPAAPWSSRRRRDPCSSAQIERPLRPRVSHLPDGGSSGGQGGLAARRRSVPGAHLGERAAGGQGTRPREEGGAERQGKGRGRRPRGREGEGPPNCAMRGAAAGEGVASWGWKRREQRWLSERGQEEEDDADEWVPRVIEMRAQIQ
jgi:hypothetical protein